MLRRAKLADVRTALLVVVPRGGRNVHHQRGIGDVPTFAPALLSKKRL